MGHKTIQMTLRYAILRNNTNWRQSKGCAILGPEPKKCRTAQLTPELAPKDSAVVEG